MGTDQTTDAHTAATDLVGVTVRVQFNQSHESSPHGPRYQKGSEAYLSHAEAEALDAAGIVAVLDVFDAPPASASEPSVATLDVDEPEPAADTSPESTATIATPVVERTPLDASIASDE